MQTHSSPSATEKRNTGHKPQEMSFTCGLPSRIFENWLCLKPSGFAKDRGLENLGNFRTQG